jgi:hypothetical protein
MRMVKAQLESKMKTMWCVIAAFFSAALPSGAIGQAAAQTGAVYLNDGAVIFSNANSDFLTIEVHGESPDIFQKDGCNFVNVNGKTIQFNLVSLSDFLSSGEINTSDEPGILRRHMKFESSYIEKNLKARLDIKAETGKCRNGKAFLVWSFPMPKNRDSVKARLFFTVVTKNHVLILEGIIARDTDYRETFGILEAAMNTLALRQFPVNPIILSDSLNAVK